MNSAGSEVDVYSVVEIENKPYAFVKFGWVTR